MKLDVTTADTSIASDVGTRFLQRFEGQDLQAFKKGTSDALEWTLSFHVKSPKTGTHCIELLDIDNTRSVSATYTITTANAWQYVSHTFPADTTGALDNDNDQSFIVLWWLAAGSTYNSGTLQTSWGTRVAANRAVGQVNVTDSTDNNFYITGCQLEVGSEATPFEHRSYADELTRNQRYYQRLSGDALSYYGAGNVDGANEAQILVDLITDMRGAPSSLETSGTASDYFIRTTSNATCTSVPSLSNRTTKNAMVIFRSTSHGFTNGLGAFGRAANVSDSYLAFSSEL